MAVLDGINRTMGRNTLWLAGQGLTRREREQGWRMKRGNLSPAYTTQWADLPVVRAC
jgi:DNA polymerase V